MSKSPIKSPLSEADKEITGNALQATLVDLVDLSLIAKQAHWNVVGANFRSAHLQLDELVNTARQYVDEVAERANAIGVSPNGKAKTVVESSGVPEYPDNWQSVESTVAAIVDILATLIERLRRRIDETDKSDLVTQDLLIEITRALEEAHWMWQAQQARAAAVRADDVPVRLLRDQGELAQVDQRRLQGVPGDLLVGLGKRALDRRLAHLWVILSSYWFGPGVGGQTVAESATSMLPRVALE
jgi:starvation-inducible DNA-binding protein